MLQLWLSVHYWPITKTLIQALYHNNSTAAWEETKPCVSCFIGIFFLASAPCGLALPWSFCTRATWFTAQQRGERCCRHPEAPSAPQTVPRGADRPLLWRQGGHEHGRPVWPHWAATAKACTGELITMYLASFFSSPF